MQFFNYIFRSCLVLASLRVTKAFFNIFQFFINFFHGVPIHPAHRGESEQRFKIMSIPIQPLIGLMNTGNNDKG